MKERIAIVEDEEDLLDTCRQILGDAGHMVTGFTRPRELIDSLSLEHYHLVITDQRLPEMEGLALVRDIRQRSPGTAVVMMTAYPAIDLAVEAMREGAFDFLVKPFSPDQLRLIAERALQQEKLQRRNRNLCRSLDRDEQRPVVWRSPVFDRLITQLDQVAATDARVLVTGETGTGKEHLAQRLHQSSPRRHGPFIALSCAAVPEESMECELFGVEAGAVPGALLSRPGLLECAEGGTFLFDEIGDLPLSLQPKLLRVLEEGSVRRVGGRTPIELDLRLVATTNRDLEQKVRDGEFRQELLYRLKVVELRVPSLRERIEDVPPLIEHFLHRFSRRYGKPVDDIAPEAREMLLRYPWPGNVRELSNVIERAVLLGSGTEVTPLDLPDEIACTAPSAPAGPGFVEAKQRQVEEFERRFVHEKLVECRGNVSRAAQLSGLGRTAFQRLMRRYAIQSESYRS